jgi:hypothetical protein
MQTLSPIDVRNIANMVLRENRGSLLTEALCIGIQETIVFYCEHLQAGAEKGLQLVEKETNHA